MIFIAALTILFNFLHSFDHYTHRHWFISPDSQVFSRFYFKKVRSKAPTLTGQIQNVKYLRQSVNSLRAAETSTLSRPDVGRLLQGACPLFLQLETFTGQLVAPLHSQDYVINKLCTKGCNSGSFRFNLNYKWYKSNSFLLKITLTFLLISNKPVTPDLNSLTNPAEM